MDIAYCVQYAPANDLPGRRHSLGDAVACRPTVRIRVLLPVHGAPECAICWTVCCAQDARPPPDMPALMHSTTEACTAEPTRPPSASCASLLPSAPPTGRDPPLEVLPACHLSHRRPTPGQEPCQGCNGILLEGQSTCHPAQGTCPALAPTLVSAVLQAAPHLPPVLTSTTSLFRRLVTYICSYPFTMHSLLLLQFRINVLPPPLPDLCPACRHA